jgi:hypothetical protein
VLAHSLTHYLTHFLFVFALHNRTLPSAQHVSMPATAETKQTTAWNHGSKANAGEQTEW